MPIVPLAGARPGEGASGAPSARSRIAALAVLVAFLGACSNSSLPPSTSPVGPTGTPTMTPSPTPSPLPTPQFSNEPDPALEQLIPATLAGRSIQKPSMAGLGLTPGDFGSAFGDLGRRFTSLVIAYVPPRLMSLYAARIAAPPATTMALQPSLAAAAEYVGVAGLHPEAWHTTVVGGHQVWTRAGDEATLPGTHLYCWTSGEYLFLLIGTDDGLDRAMVTALPGEPAPTPVPTPSVSPGASSPPASASPSAPASSPPSAS